MNLITPRLEIYPQRIEHNARSIVNLCHEHNIKVAGVTKVICAHPAVVTVFGQFRGGYAGRFAPRKPQIHSGDGN